MTRWLSCSSVCSYPTLPSLYYPLRLHSQRPNLQPHSLLHHRSFWPVARDWTTLDAWSTCPAGFDFVTGDGSYYALAPSSGCAADGQIDTSGTEISNGNARISANYCAEQMAGHVCSDGGTCCVSGSSSQCSGSACSATYVGVANDDGHCVCITGVGDCDSSNLKRDPHLFELKAPGVSGGQVFSLSFRSIHNCY